ncbi:glycosyltransferase family 8 protein [bacterium]|nr:glycosyltransferase family 8 protein [bacterium]
MINIDKIFKSNSVNIVYTTNDNYAKYMAVSVKSLIEHTSDNKNYDIIILETDIKNDLKNAIQSMADDYKNISIRFVNTESVFNSEDEKKLFCHLYYSKEVYLRLFIPEILKDYEKAIYIDCDTIIQSDVGELFDEDITNFYIAAAKEFNTITNTNDYPKVNYYFTSVLKIKDMNNYINSGVLVMNLPILRNINLSKKAFELLDIHKELLYPDQDLLNIICEDNIKIIHNDWNFIFAITPALLNDNRFIGLANEWKHGLANQNLIHYITDVKPWDNPEMTYGDIWWKYAKKTPIYQTLLKDFFDKHPEHLNPKQ